MPSLANELGYRPTAPRRRRSITSITWKIAAPAALVRQFPVCRRHQRVDAFGLVPLFSVIYMLDRAAGWASSASRRSRTAPADLTGALRQRDCGHVAIVIMAALISVPIGVMAAVFLAEIGPDTKLASGVRFAAKTLSGYPSILAGVVIYGALVVVIGVSAISGAVALALLMLPTIILTSEEAIRMVPARIREAAIGMGATRAQTVLRVMLPTAFPGILTGVMLAVARAAGETAPLLFTASFSDYWPIGGDGVHLNEPTASLAVFIYNYPQDGDRHASARWPGPPPWCSWPWCWRRISIGQSLSRRTTR